MKGNRRLSQGALAESVRRMMDPRAGYRAKNAEHRNQATPAQARAKATASLDGHKDYIRRNMVELGRSAGVPDYTLNNLVGVSEVLPGVGDALDVQDAGSMIGDAIKDPTLGKIGGAGIMALAAGLGVLPVGGDIASTALGKTAKNVAGEAAERANAVADLRRQANIERFGYDPNGMPPAPTKAGIRAYHGSPNSFDKFDLKYMGTGEGAQAYGKGHYFAGNEDVARQYRDTLVSNQGKDEAYKIGKEDLQDVYSRLSQKADNLPASKAQAQYNKMALLEDLANEGDVLAVRARATGGAYDDATVAWFEKSIAPKFNRSGTLYEVNINADPEDLLDWDAPLEGQRAFDRLKTYWDDKVGDPDIILERMGIDPKTATGKDLMQIGFDAEAGSALMKDVGVPGIKYLDGGSRAAGKGSSNYVAFDDNLIDILKKYRREGGIYDHPTVTQRDFGVDYPASKFPDGPRADALGRLKETMDGDPIGDGIVVGRRVVGGPEEALQTAQLNPLATATTGGVIKATPPGRMGGAIGRLQQDRLGHPTGITIADNLSPEKAKMATQHELGHAVDILGTPPNRPLKGGGIPVKGLSDDLKQIYDYGATGEVKRSSQPWTTPGTANYPKPEWRGENMAEAIRLYLANPGYLKQHHPEVAARVRKYVNKNPRLKDIIQFNSLVGAGAAGAGAASLYSLFGEEGPVDGGT